MADTTPKAASTGAAKPRKTGIGKCDVYLKDLDAETPAWIRCPRPVENSTQVTPTKGTKTEAKLEGGDNEDVIYGRNNYALAYQIRRTSNKEMPISDVDGVVEHRYAVLVVPRGAKQGVPGPYLANSAVSVEDAFSTQEGGTVLYTHDALLPPGKEDDEKAKKIQWGIYEVAEADGTITITAQGGDFGDKAVTL